VTSVKCKRLHLTDARFPTVASAKVTWDLAALVCLQKQNLFGATTLPTQPCTQLGCANQQKDFQCGTTDRATQPFCFSPNIYKHGITLVNDFAGF